MLSSCLGTRVASPSLAGEGWGVGAGNKRTGASVPAASYLPDASGHGQLPESEVRPAVGASRLATQSTVPGAQSPTPCVEAPACPVAHLLWPSPLTAAQLLFRKRHLLPCLLSARTVLPAGASGLQWARNVLGSHRPTVFPAAHSSRLLSQSQRRDHTQGLPIAPSVYS